MIVIRMSDPDANAARLLALFADNGEDDTHPRAVLADGDAQLWLAEDEAADDAADAPRVAGAQLGREQSGSDGVRRGFVDNLIVDAAYRRRGIGRRLMEAAETHYRDRGLAGMGDAGDADNEIALTRYESLGYRMVERYERTRAAAAGRPVTTPRARMWKQFAAAP